MADYLSVLLALTGVMLLSVASPGPNFVIVTSASISSRRAGLFTTLGLAAASGSWALLAIAGLNLVLSHAAWVETGIRMAGALYLIWLGIKMLKTAGQPLQLSAQASMSGLAAARKGYLVSMTNPKSVAFYGSIFAVMVPVHAPMWVDVAVVGLSVLVSLCWYGGMAVLASHPAVSAMLIRRKKAIDTVSGVVLVGLGGRLLVGR